MVPLRRQGFNATPDRFLLLRAQGPGQYVGRLHRLHDNKRFVQVYDHVDHYVPALTRMYERRLKGYAAIGGAIEQETSSSHAAPGAQPR